MTAVLDHYVMSSERATLASIAEDPDAYSRVIASGITAEHFAVATHRKAFGEINRWYRDHPTMPAPLEILLCADVEPPMAALANAASLVVLDDARREREKTEHVRRAVLAAERGDMAAARTSLAMADALTQQRARGTVIPTLGTAEIFEPVPPTPWKIPGLQIAPGRPAMIAAYGSGAKSLTLQSMGLSLAAGRPVWEHFETTPSRVLHLDYEQGAHASRKRYQRLALGHGIDTTDLGDRLRLGVFPAVTLESRDAFDSYAMACDGFDMVLIDALKGVTPNTDENDSAIRRYIDILTRVAERTGCAALLLHHFGKTKEAHSDRRQQLRGSSAIFDACGSVFTISPPKAEGEPRIIEHVKPPAEAEGAKLESFGLAIEDVPFCGALSGVRVVHRQLESSKPPPDAAYERDAAKLLAVIREAPGSSQNIVATKSGLKRPRALEVLNALEDEQRVVCLDGARGAKLYRIGVDS